VLAIFVGVEDLNQGLMMMMMIFRFLWKFRGTPPKSWLSSFSPLKWFYLGGETIFRHTHYLLVEKRGTNVFFFFPLILLIEVGKLAETECSEPIVRVRGLATGKQMVKDFTYNWFPSSIAISNHHK
jgi:hypothetical protein